MEGKVIDFQSNWMTHCEMVQGQTGLDTAVTSGDSNKILDPSIQCTRNDDDDDDDLEEMSRGVSRHYNDMAFAPRRLPSWKSQIWVFFKRRLVQFKRSSYTHTLDLLMVAFGGAVLGGTYLNASWHSYPQMATFSSLVIGMTSMIFSLRYFGMDTDVIRRETSTGIGIVPFFIAGNLVQLPLVFVLPMVYLAVVFPMLSPRSTLVLQYVHSPESHVSSTNALPSRSFVSAAISCNFGADTGRAIWGRYAIYVAVVWACTGLGIMISTLFHRSSAQVVAVVLSLTSAMFGGTSPTIPTMNQGGPGMFLVYDASYSRWFIEALTTAELTHVPVLYHLEVQGELSYLGYAGPSSDSGRIKFCCAMMFLMGLAARLVACLALWVTYVKS
jgi:hypothetical protein